ELLSLPPQAATTSASAATPVAAAVLTVVLVIRRPPVRGRTAPVMLDLDCVGTRGNEATRASPSDARSTAPEATLRTSAPPVQPQDLVNESGRISAAPDPQPSGARESPTRRRGEVWSAGASPHHPASWSSGSRSSASTQHPSRPGRSAPHAREGSLCQ